MLRIAVPNKGSLAETAAQMLWEAGYTGRRDPRDLHMLAFGGNGPVVAADIAAAAMHDTALQLKEPVVRKLLSGLGDGPRSRSQASGARRHRRVPAAGRRSGWRPAS